MRTGSARAPSTFLFVRYFLWFVIVLAILSPFFISFDGPDRDPDLEAQIVGYPSRTTGAVRDPEKFNEKIQALETAVDQLALMQSRAEGDFASLPDKPRYPEEADLWHDWAERWRADIERFPVPPEPEQGDPGTYWSAHSRFMLALNAIERLAQNWPVNRYGFPNQVERNGRLLMTGFKVETARAEMENAKRVAASMTQ
jgi:hypothetical protein